jgi:transcriptional regulator with PAS, ATPase and Fis domain
MQTQVRLLRVLETGEFIRVGSSKVIKTNVRVVAATNENMAHAIATGKFREDLYYRLSTVPIQLPPLRQRKEDIHLLFRKFANDFADKYRMPTIKLKDAAVDLIQQYNWPGNIRQLRNLVEQLSVIETERELDAETLIHYLPAPSEKMPAMVGGKEADSFSEREIMYKFLFDMKKDLTDLKKLVLEMISQGGSINLNGDQTAVVNRIFEEVNPNGVIPPQRFLPTTSEPVFPEVQIHRTQDTFEDHEEIEESLSLGNQEKELIKKALEKHRGKRKYAALELGISERTLYRKIKEYDIAE